MFEMHEKLCLDESVLNYFTPEMILDMGRESGLIGGSKNNTLELARKMIRKGLDILLIADITGLFKDKIEKLSRPVRSFFNSYTI